MGEFCVTFYKRLKRLLSARYPFYYTRKNIWIIAGILFLMTMTFNFLLEPFDVYTPEHKMHYFWISVIHACSPALIVILFSLKKQSPKTIQNWTVQNEVLLISLFLLFIGITQFLIRDIIYKNPNNWSWWYLFEEIRNTYLIGGLFSVILISLNLNRLSFKNQNNTTLINFSTHKTEPKTNIIIVIKSKTQGDNFSLNLSNFLFAKAVGNYLELYQIQNNVIERLVKRITLKEFEAALKKHPKIFKTHRSFLVNLEYVLSAEGNAQGYKISLKNCDEKIPVSRNKVKAFDIIIKDLKVVL